MKIVHVQSMLPEDVITALKLKTGENTIKEAISKAVYHYLECDLGKLNRESRDRTANIISAKK